MWGVWRWTDGCLKLFVVLLGLLAGSFLLWQRSPLGDQFHQELSTPLGCTWQAKVFFLGSGGVFTLLSGTRVFQQNGCHYLNLCCDVVAEWTIICIFAFFFPSWTITTLTVSVESKMHASPTRVRIRDLQTMHVPGTENSGTVPTNWLWVKAGLLSFWSSTTISMVVGFSSLSPLGDNAKAFSCTQIKQINVTQIMAIAVHYLLQQVLFIQQARLKVTVGAWCIWTQYVLVMAERSVQDVCFGAVGYITVIWFRTL